MSAPAESARTQVPPNRVQLLSAEAYRDGGGGSVTLQDPDRPERTVVATWLLLIGGRRYECTDEQMPDSAAEEWAMAIVRDDFAGYEAAFREGPRDAGYLMADLPMELVESGVPHGNVRRPSWRQRRRAAKAARRAARAAARTPKVETPPVSPPEGAPALDGSPRRSGPGVAARIARLLRDLPGDPPRFVSERPPSLRMLLAHAREGEWTTAPPGDPRRWAMAAWVYVVAAPVLAACLYMAWAVLVPSRALVVVVASVIVATTLNLLPLGDALIPDVVTVTYWAPPLDPRGAP